MLLITAAVLDSRTASQKSRCIKLSYQIREHNCSEGCSKVQKGRRRKTIVLVLILLIVVLFIVTVPVFPEGWPFHTYSGTYQFMCPPNDFRNQGLPLPFSASISYNLFKVGFIYDLQLKPHFAFETSSTINLPCNFP